MIVEKYFEDPQRLHIGTMPPRAYYVPCASGEEACADDARAASSRFQLLNGDWDFRYYAQHSRRERAFLGVGRALAYQPAHSGAFGLADAGLR